MFLKWRQRVFTTSFYKRLIFRNHQILNYSLLVPEMVLIVLPVKIGEYILVVILFGNNPPFLPIWRSGFSPKTVFSRYSLFVVIPTYFKVIVATIPGFKTSRQTILLDEANLDRLVYLSLVDLSLNTVESARRQRNISNTKFWLGISKRPLDTKSMIHIGTAVSKAHVLWRGFKFLCR